ncbi:MAG: alpha/beta hydrolase family protein [Acidimicrobiales bacterium]
MTSEHNDERDERDRSHAVTPFGWWPSPFSAAGVAAGRVSRSGLGCDGKSLFWLESRPRDGGRQVVVRESDGGTAADISPRDVSVRSRVHEYGGGAATVSAGALYYVDQADQRFYRMPVREGGTPVPLTEPSRLGRSLRHADGDLTPSARWLVCVEERLGAAGTGHRLMAVATDGSLRSVALADTGGFVASPRVSVDGSRLAWVTWRHPNMSWDGSEVWSAALEETGERIGIDAPHRVAGAGDVAVGQPLWCADGSLVVVSDRSGWWLPYRIEAADLEVDDVPVPVVDIEAEFHAPDWVLGQSTMVELADGSLACRMHQGGRDHLVRLDSGEIGTRGRPQVQLIDQPCVTITGLAVSSDGRRLGILGATPTSGPGVYEVRTGGAMPARLVSSEPPGAVTPGPSDVALAQPFVASTDAGPVPGFFYKPTNARVVGPEGARPPLVVFCHGGPTGAADPAFDPTVQFYTSRGFAVASVDYRGSSGYGRAYRRSLQGRWGIADVEDCTAYALELADAGYVDGGRMVIRGTSAGGFTAISAMVGSETFAGAASWYGVTDLEALARTTHEFESRYLDGLIGPLPAAAAEYRRRSPIHHPAEVSGAVLLLQGADDPVVPAAQSERYAEALSAHGVRCSMRVFPGESHGFRQAATIEASLGCELEFYRSVFDPAGANDPPQTDEGDHGAR